LTINIKLKVFLLVLSEWLDNYMNWSLQLSSFRCSDHCVWENCHTSMWAVAT